MKRLLTKDNITLAIFGGGFIVFLIYAIISHFVIQEKFDNPEIIKQETIGIIVGFRGGAKTAPSFNYEFSVNDKVYDGSYLIVTKLRQKSNKELETYVGKKYKVLYVQEDPTYSKLLMHKPIIENQKTE